MKWIAVLVIAASACSAGDDTTDGARGVCAFGGQLTDCPDAERTPEAACWRLVDCGRIPVDDEGNNNAFDWGTCVDGLSRLTTDRQKLVIDCIASSTCDELRSTDFCLDLGQ